MNIRLPDREEWVRIYMATYPGPIERAEADQAYDNWCAALKRGHQIREQRRDALNRLRQRRESIRIRMPGEWPDGEAERRQRERISSLFREARERMTPRRQLSAREREALGVSPSGVDRYRLPPRSPVCHDRGYVPSFAVNEDDRRREGNDDETD